MCSNRPGEVKVKENAQGRNFDPFIKGRQLQTVEDISSAVCFKKKKKIFFSVNFTSQNCEEFYVKETTKCTL